MFYITDRVKELIKFKGISFILRMLTIGFQVPPASLEGLLASHPKVRDCAVIGIYSKSIASEVPRAYIVPGSEPSDTLAMELVKFVHERVAQHKRLRGGVKFIEEIPKSASGKILRRLLKEKAKNDTSDPMETAQIKSKL
jgi:4-coumarate--CoA ligase